MCWSNLSHSYSTFDDTDRACEKLSSNKLIFGSLFWQWFFGLHKIMEYSDQLDDSS
jgi:hypothetical protein